MMKERERERTHHVCLSFGMKSVATDFQGLVTLPRGNGEGSPDMLYVTTSCMFHLQ